MCSDVKVRIKTVKSWIISDRRKWRHGTFSAGTCEIASVCQEQNQWSRNVRGNEIYDDKISENEHDLMENIIILVGRTQTHQGTGGISNSTYLFRGNSSMVQYHAEVDGRKRLMHED